MHTHTRTHTISHTNPQTLSDSIPEVARLFSFRITSTNFVRVDINASDVDIFVTASDSPHGVVQFAPPFQVNTQEDTAILMLPLQRSFGVIGPLRVNFSVTPDTAQILEDFTVSSQCEFNIQKLDACAWSLIFMKKDLLLC